MGARRDLPPLPLLLLLTMPAWIDGQPDAPDTYGVEQPLQISAPEGSTVTLPCSFFHPWRLAWPPQVTIIWRWQNFHGPAIFNSSGVKQGRHSLVGDPKRNTGSLQIRDLTKADEAQYFCRISMHTTKGKKYWQSVLGTLLIVTERVPSTTSMTSTLGTTRTTESLQATASPLIGPVVGGSLGGLILVIAVLVLIACLIRRRAGKGKEEDLKAKGSSKKSEAEYEEVGQNQYSVNREPEPEDRGLVYASLTLSDLAPQTSPVSAPSPRPREPEMLYSVVRGPVSGPPE
ncbi:paired immunoglobulin-like type 2 receptor alpha [Tachyglossus aculeatus]|uniref:paired immunoglobulin-like type 2 receptor alpha n=1 Tax=Tachyglossus aculeatus TaxID=9261 RepID=UPI0018F61591|nr:paired immunoglobulin-like type 2 receptor alpha [Tachyglossus aculeatus]